MNKKIIFSLVLFSLAGLTWQQAAAQSSDPDVDVNLWMQQPVVVDGVSTEWHEPLNNYNIATQLAFGIANDQQNLYLIIESLDQGTTGKLLRGGLTLNINTAGKKKDGMKISFLGMQHPPSAHPDSLHRDSLEQGGPVMKGHYDPEHGPGVHLIQVSGFKNIPDGSLPVPNTQGIQVAGSFNTNHDYICELAIPLAQLGLKGDELKAIAYNFKFNAPGKSSDREGKRPPEGGGGMHGGGMGGGMGGGGGMRGGGGGHRGGGMRPASGSDAINEIKRANDFWVKYELAKPASFRAN